MLWPRSNYKQELSSRNVKTFLLLRSYVRDISHIIEPMGVGRNPEESLLSITLQYFDQAMVESRQFASDISSRPSYTAKDVAPAFFDGSIFYVYIGLSPTIVMPLFDDTLEVPMDFLLYARNYSSIFSRVEGEAYETFLGDPILDKKVANYINFEHKKWKSKFVSQLRHLLAETYYGDVLFPEITSRSCYEYAIIEEHLNMLEYVIKISIDFAMPLPIFEFPFMLQREFVQLARDRTPFAHRLLLIYSILCIYCGFFMLRYSNMWAAYIQWFRNSQEITEFDRRLLDFVDGLNLKPDYDNFRDYLLKFEEYWDQDVYCEVPDYPPIM